MITDVAHMRIGESATIHGHLVVRLVTGYEVDGGRALGREEVETILAGGFAEEAARAALAPYRLKLSMDRAGLEKLTTSLKHYCGEEGQALHAMVEALLDAVKSRS